MGRQTQGSIHSKNIEKRVVERLPHYGKFDYMRLGYFSHATREVKFISREDSLTIDGETETPGYFFGKIFKDLWTAKKTIAQSDLSYPFYAVPGKQPAIVYIDIRHAFKQIIHAFGMECFIEEGRQVAYGETLPVHEAFNNKIVRGLLVTATGKTGSYQEWIDHDIRTVRFSNPNYAPHISYTIWAVLHAIQSVLSPFTVYGHTDGFIVPLRHVERVTKILSGYGFDYSIKGTGSGEIYGVGSYRVGQVKTSLFVPSKRIRRYVRDDNSKWWLNAFAEGVSLRKNVNPDDLYGSIDNDVDK